VEDRLHSPGSLPLIFEKQCGNGTSFLVFHRYLLIIVAHVSYLSIYLEDSNEALGSNETRDINVYSYTTTRLDRQLGLQNAEANRMSRKSAHECGKVFSPTHRPPLLPGDISGIHCL
jgi:hypothetical protein